jgi:hypothetical protein
MDEQKNEAPNLSAYQISSLPQSFYYIPNFISPSEEQYILQKAGDSPMIYRNDISLTMSADPK